jgi:hypothetical protein
MQTKRKSKDYIERRKHKRFTIKDVAFAILRTEKDEELGQITNISMGGLAFQYFVGNRELQKADKLDVLLADNGRHINDITFHVVDDCELVNELPFSSITKREQRIYFDNLTDDQKVSIDGFIKEHTHQNP